MPPARFPKPEPTLTLRELFADGEGVGDPPTVTLAELARDLVCSPVRLVSLVREGWLRRADGLPAQAKLTLQTEVEQPPPAAISWLRTWFLPARAKPLFSKADVAELLDLPEREVVLLAARAGVPVTHIPALGGDGLAFSAWAVKRLLLEKAGGSATRRARFDRIALLHAILEDDPAQTLSPPTFDRALEQEIARVARLDEPARSLRAGELIAQWRDAERVAGAGTGGPGADPVSDPDSPANFSPSGAPESSVPSQPAQPASGSSSSGSVRRRAIFARRFASLREFS